MPEQQDQHQGHRVKEEPGQGHNDIQGSEIGKILGPEKHYYGDIQHEKCYNPKVYLVILSYGRRYEQECNNTQCKNIRSEIVQVVNII